MQGVPELPTYSGTFSRVAEEVDCNSGEVGSSN